MGFEEEIHYYGQGVAPDYHVTPTEGATLRWHFLVLDWTGHVIASGYRATKGEALAQAVKWST